MVGPFTQLHQITYQRSSSHSTRGSYPCVKLPADGHSGVKLIGSGVSSHRMPSGLKPV